MRLRFGRWAGLTMVWLGWLAGGPDLALAQRIPPVPANFNFTADYVRLYDAATLAAIGRLQQTAFEQHKTPMVVVTIASMAQYGWNGPIEPFATRWFNAWGIGSKENNRGMLVLISVADRKARIELGADWGRSWDSYCENIMDGRMAPEFKRGRFGPGTVAGLTALAEMAQYDPNGESPRPNVARQAVQAWQGNQPFSPLSPFGSRVILPMAGLGALCLALAIFLPDRRGMLLKLGLGLIVLSLATWVVLGIVALFMHGRDGGAGGGFGSGGGFGGGFSGGGGASGSW